jgi:ABC-type sugar transport system ATPase subunit
MNTPIIETRDLHKWYSGVHALKGVSLKVESGEAVGLVGDNGAGKSTLINILSGLHHQDGGDVLVEGKSADIRSPKDAMRLGIETIYQYNSMVPLMTISRNVFIGREPLKWSIGGIGILDERKMREESVKAIVRWATPRRGDRARHALQVQGNDPGRANEPPVGEGDRQGDRLCERIESARRHLDLHQP